MSSSKKELSFNHPPADGLASQSTQQPLPVCMWSAHASRLSPSPFDRNYHALTATATADGELFLFGGHVSYYRSNDLYVLSTQNFSTTLMPTSGEGPETGPAHGAALIGTSTLLICGGAASFHEDSLHLLNLVSRKWTRVVVNGPGPVATGPYKHTTSVIGSKLYVFGGGERGNDMWTLDLNCLTPQSVWESIEPSPGNKNPPARWGQVSVTTENRIIIFGGYGKQYYNDSWSFDILTRIWTELQCTGSVPSPRLAHAAVLVDDAMYVFGGAADGGCLDDLYALQLSTQRWFKFHNVGKNPQSRAAHAMASDGTRVFVLGGYSHVAQAKDFSHIHVFDTKHIKYPEPERNTANPNEMATQLGQKSSTGPPTQEQPQHALATQSERDHCIAQLTDQLALKSTLLEQAEANAVEAAKRADDRQLMMTSLVKQKDIELVDVQSSLKDVQSSLKDMQSSLRDTQAKFDELLLSRDQQIGQYEKELANVRVKLEANESELEAVRLRLTNAEKGSTKNSTQTASSSVNRDEDQVTRRLMERVRAIEAEMVSKRWNEKSIVDMECRNED